MAETAMSGISTIKQMKYLFRQQVPGTENLYQGIGYFMRMQFWNTINDPRVVTRIRNASEEDDFRELYDGMINLMSVYINDDANTEEDINNMIFNRSMVKANYELCPHQYVMKLRGCLEKEWELLKANYGFAAELSQTGLVSAMLPSPSQIDRSNSMEGIEETMVQDNNNNFSPNAQGIHFDSHFVDLIEEKYWESLPQSDYTGLLSLMKDSLENMKEIKKQFLRYQAKMEVGLMKEEENIICKIDPIFDKYAEVLSALYTSHDRPSSGGIVEIIDAYMNMALIVQNQPQGYSIVEGPREQKNEDEEQGDSSKEPKYYRSKKGSTLSANLKILGGQHLKFFEIKSHSVTIVTEEEQQAGKLSVPSKCCWKNFEISFQGIRVYEHIRRKKQNVRHELLRLSFNVKGICCGREFELQTRSLPFHLITGSSQSLEFPGFRLWYFFCNDGDMYSNCQMDKELDKDQFLNMLHLIIWAISYGKESRALTHQEQEFLWQFPQIEERPPRTATKITEHCFLKEIIDSKRRNFTFYAWLNALINTIQKCLLKPWVNGIIYGLMTKEQAESVLLDYRIPLQTALLRPVRSYIFTPSKSKCKSATAKDKGAISKGNGAQINIAVEIKCRKNDKNTILVDDICADKFAKYGLCQTLKRYTVPPGKSRIEYILTSNNKLVSITELEHKYPPISSSQSPSTSPGNCKDGYHKCITEKFSEISLDTPSESFSLTSNERPRQDIFVDRNENFSNETPEVSPNCCLIPESSMSTPSDVTEQVDIDGITIAYPPETLSETTEPMNVVPTLPTYNQIFVEQVDNDGTTAYPSNNFPEPAQTQAVNGDAALTIDHVLQEQVDNDGTTAYPSNNFPEPAQTVNGDAALTIDHVLQKPVNVDGLLNYIEGEESDWDMSECQPPQTKRRRRKKPPR